MRNRRELAKQTQWTSFYGRPLGVGMQECLSIYNVAGRCVHFSALQQPPQISSVSQIHYTASRLTGAPYS